MIFGGIPLWLSGKFAEGDDPIKFILVESSVAVVRGFRASAIPCRSRWGYVFRGFLIPALLGALTVAAMGNS